MAGYKLFSFDKIPSTQTYAHELIASGRGADCTAIVAAAQSAGRGRYRRQWVSHHGNLYVSFIYDAATMEPRLSYAVAVAVAETLIEFGARPQIKWPNDILIDGAKIAGILIEYASPFVIIGVGINVHSNPTVDAYHTTRLDRFAGASPADVLGCLMRKMDAWRVADFSRVRNRWMELATGLNQCVKYRDMVAELIGIDDIGALILRCDGKNILVYGDEIKL